MITCNGFKLESPNSHQICILGFSQLVLKMGVIDLDLQGHLAIISTQETAFNFAFVYWSKPAKGCYTSQTCSCFLGEDHMWWLSYCKWGRKAHAEQKDKNLHAFVSCIIFTLILYSYLIFMKSWNTTDLIITGGFLAWQLGTFFIAIIIDD